MAPDGTATFLGPGGSDMTAFALAAGLGADVCEIRTDVPGILTADPAVVPGARATELALLTEAATRVAQASPPLAGHRVAR